MKNYKITILVTSYNAKKYLYECLESIINQTCDKKYFEVIVVDDGSTDGSSKVCDEYAKKYSNFKIMHQENSGGPSKGRNYGIEHASGEYIFFVDVDDYFGKEAISKLIKHIKKFHSDVILAKIGKTNRKEIPTSMFDKTYESVNIYNSKIVRTLGPWKLFNVKFLRDNNIYFPCNVMYEDAIFTLTSYFLANKISVVSDYDYYYWTKRDDGTNLSSGKSENSKNFLKIEKRIAAFKLINDILLKYNNYDKSQFEISKKILTMNYRTLVYLINNSPTQEMVDELYEVVKKWYDERYINNLKIKELLLLKAFYDRLDIEKLEIIYSKISNNDYKIKITDNKVLALFSLTNENYYIDITMKYELNNLEKYKINNIIKKHNKIYIKFVYPILFVKDRPIKVYLKTNNSYYLCNIKKHNKKIESDKLHHYIVEIDLEKLYKKSLKNNLFDNDYLNYEFLITNDNINYYGFGKNKNENLVKKFNGFFSNIENNIILLGELSNHNLCIKQISSKCNYRKIKNSDIRILSYNYKIIHNALKHRKFKQALKLVKYINSGANVYKKKYYLICNFGHKKIIVRDFSYKKIINKFLK